MIGRVSNNTGASTAANLTPKAAGTRVLCRTPFGDVMVNELSTSNLADILLGNRSGRTSAPAVAHTTATEQAAVASTARAAVAEQATTVASRARAAVGEQVAVAVSTARTAVTQQAAAVVPTAQAAPDDAEAQDTFPTAQSVFGDNPWITNPTGTAPDGSTYGYNPLYFATPATAAKVAELVGGKVVPSDQIASLGGFSQHQPNQMVELANGALINAGLVADFYNHGYSQANIDNMIQNEIRGA